MIICWLFLCVMNTQAILLCGFSFEFQECLKAVHNIVCSSLTIRAPWLQSFIRTSLHARCLLKPHRKAWRFHTACLKRWTMVDNSLHHSWLVSWRCHKHKNIHRQLQHWLDSRPLKSRVLSNPGRSKKNVYWHHFVV